jgi:hypothetical protein
MRNAVTRMEMYINREIQWLSFYKIWNIHTPNTWNEWIKNSIIRCRTNQMNSFSLIVKPQKSSPKFLFELYV